MSDLEVAIPKGSWILITGINGYLATHIATHLLSRGYKVRGTIRSPSKSTFLTNDLFKTQTAAGTFEIAHVPDLAQPEPVNLAIRGVSGIIHVAADLTFDPDPHKAITPVVSWTTNLLRAAREQAQEKGEEEKPFRFVICSTLVAAAEAHIPGVRVHVTRNGWDEAIVKRAWAPPPYDGRRAMDNYVSGKIEAERAMWKVVEEWPGLVASTVLPGMFFGPVLSREQPASSTNWLRQIYDGGPPVNMVSLSGYLDVRDNALLHVAALLDSDVKNARIIAFREAVNWNKILGVLRKLYPNRKFVDDLDDAPDMSILTSDSRELASSLLKKWGVNDGFISLEDSIKDTVDSFQRNN